MLPIPQQRPEQVDDGDGMREALALRRRCHPRQGGQNRFAKVWSQDIPRPYGLWFERATSGGSMALYEHLTSTTADCDAGLGR